jgi:glycosyltransferase involved in cell wall biosynthesis
MNLLYVTHAQYVTVALPKVIEQAEAIVALGHSLTLIATSKTNGFKTRRFEENGVRYLTTPSILWGKPRHGADPVDTLFRIGATRKESYDIVHAIDSRPTVILPALAVSRRCHCPLVMEWTDLFGHGGTISERSSKFYARTVGHVETFFEHYFRKYADRAIPISTTLMDRLLATGYPRDHILLQRVGCDTQKHKPQDKQVCRRKLGLPPEARILCYVGNIYPADMNLLVDSLEVLHGQGGRDIITVLIGGNHQIEPSLSQRLRILLTGRVEQNTLYEYLAAADVTLIPFKHSLANKARWPSKFADYVNAGRPTVATRVSDFEMLFPRYNLGFLSDDDSPEAFARAIGKATTDLEQLERIGRDCRKYAEEHLDVVQIAKERIALYEEARATKGR